MNVEWIAKLPAPIRRALYFKLQGAIGSRIERVWQEFQEWEKFTPTELNVAVESRLTRLLETATQSSEYYRDLNLARRPNESAKDWLRRFPVLSRLQVRENFPRIVLDPLRDQIKSPDSVSQKRYDWLGG